MHVPLLCIFVHTCVSLSARVSCSKMREWCVCSTGRAWGLNTRTSKNVFSYVPPPRIHLLLCPTEHRIDDWRWLLSRYHLVQAVVLVRCLHCCKPHAVSSVAVRSRISLCLIDGNPSLAQDRACSTVNLPPQTHIEGISDGVQPYLRARAS